MADTAGNLENAADRPRCRACGAAYRPPQWGREYRCAVCGSSLTGSSRQRVSFSPLWILAAGAAILGGGLWVRSVQERNASVTSPSALDRPLPAPVPQRVVLPPHFEANLRTKLAVLESDLTRDPANPGLLAAAALTSISLGVATHQTSPTDPPLRQASQWAKLLERGERPSAAQVELMVREAASLQWASPAAWSLPAALWPLQVGKNSLFTDPTRGMRSSLLTSGRFFTPRATGLGSFSFPGARARPRIAPPAISRPAGFTESDALRSVAEARARYAAEPGSPYATETLGSALLTAAGVLEQAAALSDRKSDPRANAFRTEAAGVYRTMASRAKTNTERAAFLEASADAHQAANEWDAAYEMLSRAVQLVPFSPRMWKEVQEVALQTGRLDEAERARFHAREWTMPDLRAPFASMPAPGASYPTSFPGNGPP